MYGKKVEVKERERRWQGRRKKAEGKGAGSKGQ